MVTTEIVKELNPTVTIAVVDLLQPPPVPITVNVMLEVGDTTNWFEVEPLFHIYPVPPLAVTVAVPPAHNEPEGATFTTIGGCGNTVMVPVWLVAQALEHVPTTLKTVVDEAVNG